MKRVAVVILNYNGRDLLQKFLPSVIQFSNFSRIIVADNHSTDDSVEIIKREFPSVEIIHIHANLGFCGGYNYALKKIEADYYVLLNSDVEVTRNWIEPAIELFERDTTIGVIQPKVLSYHNKTRFEYAGAAGGFIDVLGYPLCRGRIFQTLEEDRGQYNDVCPIFWATGACLFIRSSLFHTAGGFDENFFAHMEEIDLCWRIQRSGYRVYYQGNSAIYHVGGGTLSVSNPKKTYLNFRNGLSLIAKNMSKGELWYKLPIRILLDWLAALKFLIEGNGKDATAVLKAHIHFIQNLASDMLKRTPSTTSKLPIYPRSIAFDYFILKREKFSELGFNNPK